MDGGTTTMDLLHPGRLWTRAEVLTTPCPVPRSPGVYGWYFREVPPGVPVVGCVTWQGHTLLYVGIAPKHPPANGRRPSTQTLCHRIRYRYQGNAEGPTLRLTLGCLLSERLGIELRRVGSGTRMTFSEGEAALSAWMGENALVTWVVDPEPWALEQRLIASVSLPLNLDQNTRHTFCSQLSACRSLARERARGLRVLQR